MQKWSRKKQDLEYVAADILKLKRQKNNQERAAAREEFGRRYFELGFCLNGIKKCGFWAAAVLESNRDIFCKKSIA